MEATVLPKPVTVIALCYNHERFIIECLESIRSQTFQGFQLIVTDDCSKDNSAALIQEWLAEHYRDAIFIGHSENKGLCATLNEALARACGDFVSMIATDDLWEPDKIEKQLRVMNENGAGVAVVYSDAVQIDESGNRLPKNFIETHSPGLSPPSGHVFSALVERNFIPAMSTLIRRECLDTVGGYDIRLTYEDYDMWLRLAAKYKFIYSDGVPSRYRIVSTSIVRTLFYRPTPDHNYSKYLIHVKWLAGGKLNKSNRAIFAIRLWESAYSLYEQEDIRACGCLWNAFLYGRKPRALLLAISCSIGINRSLAKKISALIKLNN